MKKIIFFCLFTFAFCLILQAQNLTVKDIMREPSIAGMRPESEKLSPDGKFVVYSWNADGIEPRNLYIVDSDGGNSRILVNAEANYEQRILPPASKLDYGLTVRDDFVKAREKNLFGVEFSPDSKRILFLQNTDIYVLELENSPTLTDEQKNLRQNRWQYLEPQFIRRIDLSSNLVKAAQMVGVQEKEIFASIADARIKLLDALNEKSEESNGSKSEVQRQRILQANSVFDIALDRLVNLQENYPQLRANESFMNLKDEFAGIQNRTNAGRSDYDFAIKVLQPITKPRRITRTQGVEAGARWLTNDAILYSSGGNYYVLNLKETSLIQVTKEANPTAFLTIFNVNPTKDGKLIAYVLSDGSKQKALFVPNYLDEFVQANSTRRGFTEQKIYVTLADGSREKPFEVNLPKAEGAGYIRSCKMGGGQFFARR